MKTTIFALLLAAAAIPFLGGTPVMARHTTDGGGKILLAQGSDVPGQTGTSLFKNLQTAGETGAGYSTKGRTDPLAFATNIIKAIMGFLGVIFLALTVYGGYQWMVAGGNEQQVEKAQKTITAGVIGLAIILAGYIISINVLSALLRATGQTPAPLGSY